MTMNDMRGLWRGKRIDDGEWVKGDMSRLVSKNRYYIEDNQEDWVCEVDSSTLGECTGLTDKNGTLIFEGDIIEHEFGEQIIVVYDSEHASFGVYYGERFFYLYEFDLSSYEVVGNVYDNPELLKGADDDEQD